MSAGPRTSRATRQSRRTPNRLAFYFERSPASAFRLMLELDAVFDRIRESPTQFLLVEGSVRRALLGKFPYTIYDVLDGDTVTSKPARANHAVGVSNALSTPSVAGALRSVEKQDLPRPTVAHRNFPGKSHPLRRLCRSAEWRYTPNHQRPPGNPS